MNRHKKQLVKHQTAGSVLPLFKIQRAFTCWWQHSPNGLLQAVWVIKRHWRECDDHTANWTLTSTPLVDLCGVRNSKFHLSYAGYTGAVTLPLVAECPKEISATVPCRVLLLWERNRRILAFYEDFKSQKTPKAYFTKYPTYQWDPETVNCSVPPDNFR